MKGVRENRLGTAERFLIQKCIASYLYPYGFRIPALPHRGNANDGMRCLFVVKGVWQRARKSPRFRQGAEWRGAWQGRWIVSQPRQHFEVCFRARSPNCPTDFAAALLQ